MTVVDVHINERPALERHDDMKETGKGKSKSKSVDPPGRPQKINKVGDLFENMEGGFKCLECGQIIKTRSNTYKHAVKHGIGKKVQCDQCDAMFCSTSDLKRHQNQMH